MTLGTRGHYEGQGQQPEKETKETTGELSAQIEELQAQLLGDVAKGTPLTGREDIAQVLNGGHPAFGGKLFRKAYQLIRKAIGDNYTMFVSVAGPITASDYARVWMVPFIQAGYISAFTASDAISYHDCHDAVEGKRKIHDVDLYGDDGAYRDAQVIRITDIGFPESVLFNTDQFVSFVLTQPEFQKSMTTTEYRWLLGKYLHALEEKRGIGHGLLATAYAYDVPAFCASPADGSTFLNAMKLWVMQERLGEKLPTPFKLNIDLSKDVYEFCAMHYWCQHNEGNQELSYIVCGGGAVKNYLLQPEPALEQILFVPAKKYQIGVQMTTAPVTDGSLSSCWPSEAISWGKLQKDALTVSVPADYTMLMSVIGHAILKERALYEDALKNDFGGDLEKMSQKYPQVKGFLRKPLRLYGKREEAMKFLDEAAKEHVGEMRDSLEFAE